MPREKEGKGKTKGALLPIVPTLQKFLKTYEKHCAQTRTSMCPAIKRDLKTSINHERILRKFVLIRPDDSPPSILPISLEPLLMTVRDECYVLGKEICIWGFQLSNPEIARLALLLESKGCTPCPFTTLELIDCKMDPWSLGRLGKALQFSSLHFLVLDYCKVECGDLGMKKLRVFSQAWRTTKGFKALVCATVVWGHRAGRGWAPSYARAPSARQRESSTLNEIAKSSGAVTVKTTSGKKKRKGIKKKIKDLTDAGPWLVKLYLADNGIDGKGKEGENDLLEFTHILTCLIKYSAHLREIDLGNNVLGEMAAVDILEALRDRKTGKLPVLKITVTPQIQISSDTFSSIWKNSKKSSITCKRKKKAKN